MISKAVLGVFVLVAWAAPSARATEANLSIDAAYDAYPTPDPLCSGFHVVGDGEAAGPPVAKAVWHDEECADLAAQPGSVSVRDGHLTLTSANGDVLDATYHATGTPPDAEGYIYISGSFRITGGSGRFEGGGGEGTVTAVANVNFPATTAHLDGWFALRDARRV